MEVLTRSDEGRTTFSGLPQRRITDHTVPSKSVSLPSLPRCPNNLHNAFFEEIWNDYVNNTASGPEYHRQGEISLQNWKSSWRRECPILPCVRCCRMSDGDDAVEQRPRVALPLRRAQPLRGRRLPPPHHHLRTRLSQSGNQFQLGSSFKANKAQL